MNFQKDCQAKCADEFCSYGARDEAQALATGWFVIENQLYCPLHAAPAARAARLKAEFEEQKARMQDRKRAKHQEEAKIWFSARDYAAWEEFQQEMVNFHKKHHRLAPARLRLMHPKAWLNYTNANGPIDVETTAQELDAAEQRAAKTRNWLARRVE